MSCYHKNKKQQSKVFFIFFIGPSFMLHPSSQRASWCGDLPPGIGAQTRLFDLCQEAVTGYLCIFVGLCVCSVGFVVLIYHSHSAIYTTPWNYLQNSTNFQVLKLLAQLDIVSDTCHPAPCYLNSDKVSLLFFKYFYFWAIDIVIQSRDSNLGPKPLSLLEFWNMTT